MQLGYLPRMRVLHTSADMRGQVYLPAVSAMLLVLVLVLAATIGFGSSSALAASFGIAVSGTMLMTTTLALLGRVCCDAGRCGRCCRWRCCWWWSTWRSSART